MEPVARLRITLQEIEPVVWRRIDVPLSSTLLALHDFIQFVFGWTDSHLFEFEVGARRYGQPEYDPLRGREALQGYEHPAENGPRTAESSSSSTCTTLATTGDTTLSSRRFATVSPTSTTRRSSRGNAGALRRTWEASPGFMEFLEAMLNPLHEEHESVVRWYGRRFEPDDIDEQRVRMCFAMAAARRRGPLMSHRSGGRRERT